MGQHETKMLLYSKENDQPSEKQPTKWQKIIPRFSYGKGQRISIQNIQRSKIKKKKLKNPKHQEKNNLIKMVYRTEQKYLKRMGTNDQETRGEFQHYWLSEIYRLKLPQDSISPQSGWLSSDAQRRIHARVDVGKEKPLYLWWQWKTIPGITKIKNLEINVYVSLLYVYLKNFISFLPGDTCISMSIAALVTIIMKQDQHKYLSTKEQKRKM